MKSNTRAMACVVVMAVIGLAAAIAHVGAAPGRSEQAAKSTNAQAAEDESRIVASAEDARIRARLLHDTIHTTLRVIHREFYREDEGLPIPSRTLNTVFNELTHGWNIKFRWMSVDARAMSIDHEPRDDFERAAAKALASGEDEFEAVSDGVYRRVGPITLGSECLKCHLPNRTSTRSRTAGLVISMPLKQK